MDKYTGKLNLVHAYRPKEEQIDNMKDYDKEYQQQNRDKLNAQAKAYYEQSTKKTKKNNERKL
jgi:hypothetical protein